MRGLFFHLAVENGIPWHTYDNPDLPDYYSLSDVAFDADGNAWCTPRSETGSSIIFPGPIQSGSPLQPVDGIFGPLFDMVWDACGYLYIYSTGAVLPVRLP